MFNDSPFTSTNNSETLGRYLGPAPDIGSAFTAKLLTCNGEMIPRSTFNHLTDDGLQSSEHQELWKAFDLSVTSKLGPQTSPADFLEEQVTPECERYEDMADSQEGSHANPEELELEELTTTPKPGDSLLRLTRLS